MVEWQEFLLHAGTGSIASMAGVYVGAPLDTIKVNLQSRADLYKGKREREKAYYEIVVVIEDVVVIEGWCWWWR